MSKQKWKIEMSEPQVSFTIVEGESIFDGLQRVDRRHPAVGCRNGGCGVCRMQVTEGSYDTGRMSRDHVSVEDEAAGIVLACRTYPTSDLHCMYLGRKPV